MKVLVDNYNKKEKEQDTIKVTSCEWCSSKFEYDLSDIHYDTYEPNCVVCPCCGKLTSIDEKMSITPDNVRFPEHFYHTSRYVNAVHIEDDKVEKWIREGIESIRNHREWDGSYMTESGDTIVDIIRCDEDEEYLVRVSQDYYEIYIPFEQIDYA